MSLKKNTKRNSSVKVGDPGYLKDSWMNCSSDSIMLSSCVASH